MKKNELTWMIIFLVIAVSILISFSYYHFQFIFDLQEFFVDSQDSEELETPESLDDLIKYTEECGHTRSLDGRINLGLLEHNPEYLNLVAQGYTLKEACKDDEQIFVFMDFQNGYYDLVDSDASAEEIVNARKKAIIGSADASQYSNLRLFPIELIHYDFGDRHTPLCQSLELGDLNMIYFECDNIGGDVKSDYTYHYNIPDDELILFSFSRHYEPEKFNGMKYFEDVDLKYGFEYQSDWGDITTIVSDSAVKSMGLVEEGRAYHLVFSAVDDDFPIDIDAFEPEYAAWEGPSYPGWQRGMSALEYCELFAESGFMVSYGCEASADGRYVDLDYAQIEYGECCPIGYYRTSFIELDDDAFGGMLVTTQYFIDQVDDFEKENFKEIVDEKLETFEVPQDINEAHTNLVESIELK